MGRCFRWSTAVLVLLFAATSSFGKVATIPLEALVAESEVIVVAQVENISNRLFGKRYAKAKVIEIWKGSQIEDVEFLASRTWTCDVSMAEKGEIVLLFLVKSKESRSYQIAHSGRGRMPQRTVKNKSCVLVLPEIFPPTKLGVVIDDSEPDWVRLVETHELRSFVKQQVENKK